MSKLWALIGAAAALSAGYILGKKLIEDNPETFVVVKENCGEKLHKASVCCAGVVKTGSEKVTQSVNRIVESGRVKSGEMIRKMKTKSDSFKNELSDLKDKVLSASDGAEVDIYDDEEIDPLFTYNGTFDDIDIVDILEEPEEGSDAL